jgi:hypothetical protein
MGDERFWGARRALHVAFTVAVVLAGGCNAAFGIHDGTPPPPCYDPKGLLIDDMEDQIGDICNLDGRHGYWYTGGDGTSTMLEPAPGTSFEPTMIPGGRGQSHYAARFTGSGFTDWGAAMGFDLDDEASGKQTYDASSAGGITFWMKNSVPVSVEFLIPETVLTTNGGDCVSGGTDPNCDSEFSFQITVPSTAWVQYYVPFAALAQSAGGTVTFSAQQLLGVQFLVAPGAAFDVWVDDVSFYPCSGTACVPTCVDPAFPVSCPASGSHPAACLLAGTDCAAVATWCSDPQMIDDMEDGNNLICKSGGRSGNWYTVADGTEGTLSPAQGAVFTMTPIPGGRGDSRIAARMTASGFTSWAQMGLDLKSVSGVGMAYDASATGGITFWMKTTATSMGVNLHISATDPVSRGGLCADSATTYNCDNAFSFGITSPHPDDWFQYYVPYGALWQPGEKGDANGNLIAGSATWDPTALTNITFTVNQPGNVELWIDDLSFYDCSGAACVPTCSDPTAPVACPALGAVPANCWPAGTDCSTVTHLLWDSYPVSLWGSATDDVWAVGFDLQGPSGVIVKWNGSAWSSVATGGAGPLWGVWGSAADDVWAVGDGGSVDHWNGTLWSVASTDTQASLNAVWGSGPNDVWAVGANGAILHYDGKWSVSQNVSSKTLYRLWGTAQNDVWAVGDAGTILHFDGTRWSPSTSGTDSILYGVWASDRSNAYAVGNTASGDATVLQWNGTAWSPVSTMAAPYPNAVWGSGPGDVWIVGESILHWDGVAWSAVPSPTPDYLYDIWGIGPTDAWIAASGTTLHWDSTMIWSVVPTAGIPQ